tara:strand:+ start:2135 stop:2917 length:783 start_codon:yes stop_codon:yes gene_type:complete
MAAVTAAVVGIGTGVASSVMGFQQAAKQRDLASDADEAAEKALKEAKRKAEKDYYEGLNVPLDAYEAEFEQNLAVAKQQTEALQEGDARALAAGAGRIGAQAAESAEKTRIAMGEEISDLNKMKADSKEAINQQLIEMDVAAAKEQNLRKRDAEAAQAAGIQQGISGLGQTVASAASLAPLYGQSAADKRGSKLAAQFKGSDIQGDLSDTEFASRIGDLGLSRKQFKQFKGEGGEKLFGDYLSGLSKDAENTGYWKFLNR